METSKKKILVLSSAESEYTVEANRVFVEEIGARLEDVVIETHHYNDFLFEMSAEGMRVSLIGVGTQLADFDLIYFKSFYRYVEIAQVIARAARAQGVAYICKEIDDGISMSKLTQYARLSAEGIRFPRTMFAATHQLPGVEGRISESLGYPFVMKAADGKGGEANYLIRSKDELEARVAEQRDDGAWFVLQEFIPNEYDLRVLIAGDKVRLIIKRQRIDESTHLNNTSQGAQATLLPVDELSDEATQTALAVARLFKRDIAGVDVMFASDTELPYILEVNASPQVATGAFQTEKLDVYAQLFRELL